jgi:hypothetical protein
MTLCDRCLMTLTNSKGQKVHSAHFDVRIKHQHQNDWEQNIIYAQANAHRLC